MVVLSLSLVVSTGSSFRRHFGEKPIFWVFLGPISPLLWGYEADIWGHILRLGLNMRGKFQGRSSTASYICQVSHVGILGVSAQHWGGLLPAASPLGPKCLRHYVLRNSLYEFGKFGFSDSFPFGDMKAPILRFVQWRCLHGYVQAL